MIVELEELRGRCKVSMWKQPTDGEVISILIDLIELLQTVPDSPKVDPYD